MRLNFMEKPVELPAVVAPSLDGLSIVMAPLAPVSESDILDALEVLLRAHAVESDKDEGQPLALTDEACVSIVGFIGGQLIPFSPQFQTWLPLARKTSVPDLGKAIAEGRVGGVLRIEAVLPADFVLPQLRGKTAVYLVKIEAARTVQIPAPTDKAFLTALGVESVPDALRVAADSLVARRRLEQSFNALKLALDAAASKVTVSIPPSLLDQELWNYWREHEGKAMSDCGLVGQEMAQAFDAWKSNLDVINTVKTNIRNSAVLTAIAQAHASELTAERITAAAKWIWSLGGSDQGIESLSTSSAAQREQFAGVLTQLATCELILEKTQVTWAASP
jgi:trigger factor